MNSEFLIQATVLVFTNAVTAWIMNSSAKRKNKAEATNLISESYSNLVEDLQTQIELLKKSIEGQSLEISELKRENTNMRVHIADMSLKIKALEIENKTLKKSE
jgi:predicted RNase H-like nuclease (RuvC/YqgF family)